MKNTSLPLLEQNFLSSGNNGEYKLSKISVPVKGEQLKLAGYLCVPKNRSGYYYAVQHPKERIVLHFTAGQVRSDISVLTRNNYHVSVPFVIARDGTIYQLFSSKYWSGHIGKGIGNIASGNAQDKVTIGIELSNYGFLTERDGKLETYYSRQRDNQGNTGPVDVYCSLTDTIAYQKLQTPFRDQQYYAKYTDAQYESLIVLLRYLTVQYNIPRAFLPEEKRYKTTDDVLNFKGIVSHVNYRPSGKWDIGPAFDWEKVISGVQAETYLPQRISRAVFETTDTLTDESVLDSLMPQPKDAVFENDDYDDISRTFEDLQETESATAPTPKRLFALLVGINEYKAELILEGRVRFPELNGCVQDAEKIKKYLELDNSTVTEGSIKLITDNQATKQEIVRLFREHLGQAQEGDVVLFYYSGHGTQEWADTSVWKSDTDGKLESIACYYDETNTDNFLLSDKELRYLIHEISLNKPHIVTIFDCCHSADNTRNGSFVETAFEQAVEKRIPFVFKKRDWEKFIFSDQININTLREQGEAKVLPEGIHVQLSACESDESAMEVAGAGVFTETLLKVLEKEGGDVTYHALRSRIRQYLRNVYEQKPRIYIANGDEALLYTVFLNKSVSGNNTIYGDVTYNSELGWQLNLGAIHGIGTKTNSVKIINPDDLTLFFNARIGLIGPDYTQLIFSNRLDQSKAYKAYIEGLLSQNLKVNIQNIDGLPADHQVFVEKLLDSAKGYIIAEDKEDEAQYAVLAKNGKYYITPPNDPFRPLTHPVSAISTDAPLVIADYLKGISKWEYLKNFSNQNPNDKIPDDALKVTLYKVGINGEETELKTQKDEVDIYYDYIGNRWQAYLKVVLSNTTTTNLYCCALYLTSSFGSNNAFLNPPVYLLEPGNSVELKFRENNAIPVILEEYVKWYNWKVQTEYLKFIISTKEFDASALRIEELPKPHVPKITGRGVIKSLAVNEEEIDRENTTGWTTQLITLRQQNPEPNFISETDLKMMLNDQELTDFALGIYFEAYVNENRQPMYRLKPKIKLITEDGRIRERGLIQDKVIDIANWWSRRKRNIQYKQMVNRFPNRLRIVSEGDSWFQHPLVVDIIDHLSRTYSVYCVSAAGDTLKNYLSGTRKNGEYYLDALDEQKPSFFLISGGGNDILGSQFRTFLLNPDGTVPEGEMPERFLNNAFFDELKSLMEVYRTLFDTLESTHPDLQIIVHGYDYPVKLNDAKKGWLGRYMIEKGIHRAGDRKAIIRFIMDKFNELLQEVTINFKNVTFLDVRNTVHYNEELKQDEWYDEIHPNNEGFQLVAMKFMQKINEINKQKLLQPAQNPPEIVVEDLIKEEYPEAPKPTFRGAKAAENIAHTATRGAAPSEPATLNERGQLEYDIPNEMQTGITYTCKVNIADKNVASSLLKISKKSLKADIRIANEMSVNLIDVSGGKNFTIFGVNSETQAILPDEVTTWVFKVSPTQPGRFSLLLRVTLHIEGNLKKDLNILEKEVLVSSGPPIYSNGFITNNRILFLSANPADTERLRIGAEAREIKEELQILGVDDKVLFTLNPAVTTRTMMRSILQEKPTIVHFSGHGDSEGLYLETDGGLSKLIDEESLDTLFDCFKDDVKCVVLNSCYSEAQANVIAKHVPFVIGMKKAIEDEAAIDFSIGFYQGIASGEDIETSYKLGLTYMAIENGRSDTLVLYENGEMVNS